jgi:hypothetical protein
VTTFSHQRKRAKGLLAILSLIGVFALLPVSFNPVFFSSAYAETRSFDEISLVHNPPKELPAVGDSIEMTLQLKNTQTFDYQLLGTFVIDGKISEMLNPFATLDNYERPTYNFKIISPVKSLSYSFKLYGPNGQRIESEIYTIARECIANLNPDVSIDNIDKIGIEELSDKADNLERQREAYSESIKLLIEIDELLQDMTKK